MHPADLAGLQVTLAQAVRARSPGPMIAYLTRGPEDALPIVDLSLTKVVDGDLCSVYSWYDNEFGFTNSLVEHVVEVAKHTGVAV